jgi:hypothetical protein
VARLLLRIVLLVVLAALFVDRFAGPDRSNPPADPVQRLEAAAPPPAPVQAILRRACYDCHSNETRWPWYAQVPPGSYLVAHHVKEGRAELNFSSWGGYTAKRQAHKLKEACEQVEQGKMPMSQYLLLHRDARLAAGDVTAICDWARAESAKLALAVGPGEGERQ